MVQSNVLNSTAHESIAARGSTNDMAAPEMISKAVVQSNVLNSAAVATQGSPNSAAEPARELCVSTVAAELAAQQLAASDSAALSTTLDGGANFFWKVLSRNIP